MEQIIKQILAKAGFPHASSDNLKALKGRNLQLNVASLGYNHEVWISAAYLDGEGVVVIETCHTTHPHNKIRAVRIYPKGLIICSNSHEDAPNEGMTPLAKGDTFKIAA